MNEGHSEIAVVLVAAGRGERAGSANGPKQYREIGGRAVIAHTVDAFRAHPGIGRIVVAIHPDDEALFLAAVEASDRLAIVEGGATRQASTLAALRALCDPAPQAVLIHDGVRPFVDAALIDRVIAAIGERHAAVPAMPVADTLKRTAKDLLIEETVPRDGLWAAQTPQGFPFRPILAAHEQAFRDGRTSFTDDAAIAEWAGIPVRVVAGSADNLKLTWARDVAMADQRLGGGFRFPDVRTGTGYDVHAFAPGERLMLCGVEIAHSRRLSGHSDADVGLHALTDALLATCGEGDIGAHFPPADPQWRGAASSIFVKHAARLVRERGGRIASADVTLICEAPRIGPHRGAMAAAVAAMLGIAAGRVSIKATTNERLGFIGREEGIAAIAAATVVYAGEVPA